MGNAFVALSDDTNALLFNPAGAAQTVSSQLSFAYSKPFAGLDIEDIGLQFAGSLVPVSDIGVIGVGWASLNADVFKQNDVSLLLATSLNRWLPDLSPNVSLGSNARFLHQEFTLDARTQGDSVFAKGRSNAAAAVDLGLWTRPDPRVLPGLTLGLAAKSINEPDMGLSDRDPVHRELIGGAAYIWRRLTIAADLSQRNDVAEWRGGLELWLLADRFAKDTLALRAGGNSNAASAGLGYVLRLGRSFSLNFDYAYSFPFYVEDSGGSHRAALGVKW